MNPPRLGRWLSSHDHARVLLDRVGCEWTVQQEEQKTSIISFDRVSGKTVHTERWLVFTSELGAVHRLHEETDDGTTTGQVSLVERSDEELRSLLERSLRTSFRS